MTLEELLDTAFATGATGLTIWPVARMYQASIRRPDRASWSVAIEETPAAAVAKALAPEPPAPATSAFE